MAFFKALSDQVSKHLQDQQYYQSKQDNITKAFKALESNDLKTLMELRRDGKISHFSVNEQEDTLLAKLLATQNHRAILPLLFGIPDDPLVTSIPNIRALLRDGPSFRAGVARDTKPLLPEEIFSFIICLAVHQLPSTLRAFCARADTSDMINVSMKNNEYGIKIMPYLHEQVWLHNCATTERMAQAPKPGDVPRGMDIYQQIYVSLQPYMSPRAFESLTDCAPVPERDLPKTTAFVEQKHTQWKAMSKQRNELVKQWIRPCEHIVRGYLEGNEYQCIDYLVYKHFEQRREITEISLDDDRKYLHEYMIMDYVGGQEYLTALKSFSLYNAVFQKLYQRFEAIQLHQVVSHESIGRPTQLITDYCDRQS